MGGLTGVSLAQFDDSIRAASGEPFLIGVDEAGRGPLAGPVVAAAVRLSKNKSGPLEGARDSKKLAAARRERLYMLIREHADAVSVAWAHPDRIDRDNILQASLAAMARAAMRASRNGPALLLVDGPFPVPALPRELRQKPLIKGDDRSLAVACASIVAKVVRDRWMRRLSRRYPGFGFERHKGYPTAEHVAALREMGPSKAHRRSFAPVRGA